MFFWPKLWKNVFFWQKTPFWTKEFPSKCLIVTLEKIDFLTFLAILLHFRPIFGSENRLKMQICRKSELWSRRLIYTVNYAFHLNSEWENIFFDWILWYPATSWYPQKQHLLLLEPHWLTLVLGPEHGFHPLYYLWTQNLKDPSGSVFLAKIVKKCVLLTKNSILD